MELKRSTVPAEVFSQTGLREAELQDIPGILDLYDAVVVKPDEVRLDGGVGFQTNGAIFVDLDADVIGSWIHSDDYMVLVIDNDEGMPVGFSTVLVGEARVKEKLKGFDLRVDASDLAYGVCTFVHPEYRRHGISRVLELAPYKQLYHDTILGLVFEVYRAESFRYLDGYCLETELVNQPASTSRNALSPVLAGDRRCSIEKDGVVMDLHSELFLVQFPDIFQDPALIDDYLRRMSAKALRVLSTCE